MLAKILSRFVVYKMDVAKYLLVVYKMDVVKYLLVPNKMHYRFYLFQFPNYLSEIFMVLTARTRGSSGHRRLIASLLTRIRTIPSHRRRRRHCPPQRKATCWPRRSRATTPSSMLSGVGFSSWRSA